MAKKYYWLKLKNTFFSSRAVKRLRKEDDSYVIIYLKLQLLSLEDEGRLYFEGVEDTFEEEMALAIDEDAEKVKATLKSLEQMKLIEKISDAEYLLCEVPLSIGSEVDSAERVREHRKRKALTDTKKKEPKSNEMLPSNTDVTKCNADVTECNADVTKCNTEIEKEKEIDTEIETEKRRDRVDYQLIADMYNDTCVSFPRLKSLSDSRKKAIKARLNVYTVDDFQKVFILAENSKFLKGANKRNWSANFDWMIKDANFAKILDGNYQDRKSKDRQEFDEFYEMTSKWAESEEV